MVEINYRVKEVNERAIDELIGLCRGMTADGVINQKEAEYVYKWLVANESAVVNSPMLATLLLRIRDMLSDNLLDAEESKELFETFQNFTGSDYEIGEKTKSTSLPLDVPEPSLSFENKVFCFTGTFELGTRSDCHKLVEALGASVSKSITKKLDCLVIGKYATDNWMHSSYGRKIEKAVKYRDDGEKICIISEDYFLKCLP